MDTGYSWEQVGRLTVPRYRAIYRHLAKHPPVQWMVQAYLGIKVEEEDSDDYVDINDLDLPGGALSVGIG